MTDGHELHYEIVITHTCSSHLSSINSQGQVEWDGVHRRVLSWAKPQ